MAKHHKRYGLPFPLKPLYAPWQFISMDFITDLPVSGGCDDRFTKMTHSVLLSVSSKTAVDLARTFAREIRRIHGLPQDITSDRDSRFAPTTW